MCLHVSFFFLIQFIFPGSVPLAYGRSLRRLLHTSDAADDLPCVDLGGSRIIKKKKKKTTLYLSRGSPDHAKKSTHK